MLLPEAPATATTASAAKVKAGAEISVPLLDQQGWLDGLLVGQLVGWSVNGLVGCFSNLLVECHAKKCKNLEFQNPIARLALLTKQ